MKYFETKKDSLEEVISKAINEDNRPSAKDLLEAGGKYMKYSDLLLQKGRLMQQNKNTAMIDKEISKEMKKLGIKEATGDKEKYQKFFQSALKKFGVDSPADLDGEKKKEFFNYVDKNYKGDHEEEVGLDEGAPRKPLKKMSVRDVSKDVDGIKKGKELRIDGVKNPSELVKQLKDKYGSKIKAYVGPTNITVTKEELDNSLASQTMRVISQTSIKEKIDPADVDDVATADDRKAADKNIIIQLRRAQDMQGKADVTFKDKPSKKEKIDIKVINKALDMFDKMRPNDKAKMQTMIGKSYRDLLKTVQRGRI